MRLVLAIVISVMMSAVSASAATYWLNTPTHNFGDTDGHSFQWGQTQHFSIKGLLLSHQANDVKLAVKDGYSITHLILHSGNTRNGRLKIDGGNWFYVAMHGGWVWNDVEYVSDGESFLIDTEYNTPIYLAGLEIVASDTPTAVPFPASLPLLLAGLGGLGVMRRRHRRAIPVVQ